MQEALARSMTAPPPVGELAFAAQDHEQAAAHRRTLCAKVAGFTLHAGRSIPWNDRESLEQLCRYGLRAPFSQERLQVREDGQVAYTLARPWPDSAGVTELVLDPIDFLKRLAVLIPAPYTHLVRRHGVFAGHSKDRWRLPPPPRREDGDEAQVTEPERAAGEDPPPGQDSGTKRPRWSYTWSQLIQRVFFADSLRCPRCSKAMCVLAVLTDPDVVGRILGHLGVATRPLPLAPARGRPGLGDWDGGHADLDADARDDFREEGGFGEERAPP
jgi:hypothetical protein